MMMKKPSNLTIAAALAAAFAERITAFAADPASAEKAMAAKQSFKAVEAQRYDAFWDIFPNVEREEIWRLERLAKVKEGRRQVAFLRELVDGPDENQRATATVLLPDAQKELAKAEKLYLSWHGQPIPAA